MAHPKPMIVALWFITSSWFCLEALADPPAPVIPSSSSPYGQSYNGWSASWWQWAFSLPADQHPLFDTADCSEGQTGRVWFLGGTFAALEGPPGTVVGEADRACTVPPGTALFFPIVNVECDSATFPGATETELRECANFLGDHIQTETVQVLIDGVGVDHLGLFRFESELFNFGPLPEDNILLVPGGTSGEAIGDGFYVMLHPLSRGTHEIHFEGSVVFTAAEDGFDFEFIQDINYLIDVGD